MKIDFHAHVLPGCDHGSCDCATSLKQILAARDAGIDIICATSHFYPELESVREYLGRRDSSYSAFEEYLSEQGIEDAPKIIKGAEVLLCPGLARLPELEKLCLEGTKLLLLEMPFSSWTYEHLESVEELLRRKDIQPVIAHADRYAPADIEQMLEYELPLQLNTSSLSFPFIRSSLKKWIDRDLVCALGSDIHGDEQAYKHFRKAEKKLKKNFDKIMLRTENLIFK